jgi:transcriptional regulator with XRE-family HTH domain
MTATLIELRERAEARRGLAEPEERRRLREQAGFTQIELASFLGVTSAAVSLWEAGRRRPRGRVLERYIAALDVFRESLEDAPANSEDAP